MKKIFIIIFIIFGMSWSTFAEEITSMPKRIVSLAPSTTEILFSLGLGDRIVGVTTFCDYPEEAKAKPKIGGMSNPSLEAIITLKPDLVVMTMDGNPREVEERLRSLKIKTYVFKARMLHELPGGMRELGVAVNTRERADKLANDIERGLAENAKRKMQNAKYRKALFIVWPEPLIVAGPGTAIDDAMALIGLENTASRAKTTYPRYSIEEVIRQAPDVLFIGKGSGMDMSTVSKGILKKLSTVPAVKNGAVYYVSDSLYRLGPRVVQGIEELAECVR
jgi:iron complex transport system substrate-binding protein